MIKETTSADGRIRKIDIKIAENKVNQSNVEAQSKDVSNFKNFDIPKKETNMKSQEDKQEISNANYTTLSKTPSIGELPLATIQTVAKQFMISPGLFKKKPVSRFKFAHSVDPIKNLQKQYNAFEEDENEIEVPKSIQDLIESKIRTLSNSLSTAKS